MQYIKHCISYCVHARHKSNESTWTDNIHAEKGTIVRIHLDELSPSKHTQVIMLLSQLSSCLSRLRLFHNPMEYRPPGSFVHGISQARIPENSFSGGSCRPRDQTYVSCIGRWILYQWATRQAQVTTTQVQKIAHTSTPESSSHSLPVRTPPSAQHHRFVCPFFE